MTDQLTVAGSASRVLDEVVASLPRSFAHVPRGGEADIAVVEGSAGWPERVRGAVSGGARGVVVLDPCSADSSSVATAVPVVLSESWAGNPTVLAVAERWRSAVAGATLIESTVTEPVAGRDAAELVLRQLRLLRRLGVPDAQLESATRSHRSYSLAGRAGTATVSLLGVATDADPEALDAFLIGVEETLKLRLHPSRTARPAQAKRLTTDGGELLPTIWETAHRAAFRRIRDVVLSGGGGDDLDAFADDSARAVAAIGAEA
jgi:hypothetical protein